MVALAGPIMNLLMAFVVMVLWFLTMHWVQGSPWSTYISRVFQATVFMNLGLGIFNLLPIPPHKLAKTHPFRVEKNPTQNIREHHIN